MQTSMKMGEAMYKQQADAAAAFVPGDDSGLDIQWRSKLRFRVNLSRKAGLHRRMNLSRNVSLCRRMSLHWRANLSRNVSLKRRMSLRRRANPCLRIFTMKSPMKNPMKKRKTKSLQRPYG